MFFAFYYILSLFLYLISLPFLLILTFKSKYKKSIPARFFLYKNPPFKEKRYWFHSCSLGETKALKPVMEQFEKINLSVITNTGYEEALKYKNADVRFLPYEIFLPFWIKPCNALIVMEAELWYMLFFIAKKRCEKTILLNARISEKSYPKYLKFRWFYKKIFENIDLVLAQSDTDKKRLITLGAKNVKVVGNIKTYFNPKITTKYIKNKPLIVVASTHANEEKAILDQLPLDEFQVVVVPRHPERFDEVHKIMENYGKVERISDICNENKQCKLNGNLILMDKMGELVNLYAVCDIVILGGSFVDNVGGHNPIEAAYFNKPIISGKYVFNQKALYNEVEGIVICEINEIKENLKSARPTSIKNRVDINNIISLIVE
ncbi:lipid IV(A) 3-deoxy-D-manno-octulosonic acid transferase [Nautilia lithotrophica]